MLDARTPRELAAVRGVYEKYEQDYRAYVEMLRLRPPPAF